MLSKIFDFPSVLSPTGMFTDGLWHAVYVDVEAGTEDRIGKINITVDGRQDTSERQLTFTMTETVFLGGGKFLTNNTLDLITWLLDNDTRYLFIGTWFLSNQLPVT